MNGSSQTFADNASANENTPFLNTLASIYVPREIRHEEEGEREKKKKEILIKIFYSQ